MSIAKRVEETFERLEERDPESAFLSACIATDATAGKEYPALNVRKRYKKHLQEYRRIIGFFAFNGVALGAIKFRAAAGVSGDKEGRTTLDDVLYEAVRCALVHEAEISKKVKLSEDSLFQIGPDGIAVSSKMPLGLAMAAVASPSNATLRTTKDWSV